MRIETFKYCTYKITLIEFCYPKQKNQLEKCCYKGLKYKIVRKYNFKIRKILSITLF